jgi:hypothetical protein
MAITKATASSIAPAAKGSIVVGSATNDAGVLAVGTDTHILVADSAESLGMKWAAPSGGDLVKTGSTTFTTVNSFSMDNVFTSTYGMYLIRIVINTASAGSFGTFRYRASGTAATSSYYWNNQKITMANPPTDTYAGALNQSSIRIDQTGLAEFNVEGNRASLIFIKSR